MTTTADHTALVDAVLGKARGQRRTDHGVRKTGGDADEKRRQRDMQLAAQEDQMLAGKA